MSQTWVTPTDLIDHLTLLHAFQVLRTLRPEPEFLHHSLFRFELFIGRLSLPITIDRLPPLDVLMVWHAYCLGSRLVIIIFTHLSTSIYLSSTLK